MILLPHLESFIVVTPLVYSFLKRTVITQDFVGIYNGLTRLGNNPLGIGISPPPIAEFEVETYSIVRGTVKLRLLWT